MSIKQTLVTLSLFALVSISLFFTYTLTAVAAPHTQPVRVDLDAITIQRGFTLETAEGEFRLGVTPNAVGERDHVRARIKPVSTENVDLQDEVLLSNLYSFDLFHEDTLEVHKPLWISAKWNQETDQGYVLKNWDSNKQEWVEIPSSRVKTDKGWVQAAIHLPYAIIGVFETQTPTFEGEGSWYRWHGAAMNDLPIGTDIRITHPETGAFADTTVVSTGPFTPGRLIDIPADIFEQFAPLSQGVVQVKVTPLQ